MPDVELNSDIKKNSLFEESLGIENLKSFLELKNDSYLLKPLGDITIEIDDIVPCMYSTIALIYNFQNYFKILTLFPKCVFYILLQYFYSF